MTNDLKFACRQLLKNPGFTIVAALTLALGIGANTTLFSLADAVIFRDLPVKEPQRLFQVRATSLSRVQTIFSYPLYRDVRDNNRTFSQTVCAGSWANPELITLEAPDQARRVARARLTAVSGNYFDALGVRPVIGRSFTPLEDVAPGAHPVAVISYRFWKRELGGDPNVLGARFLHNAVSYQILGVAPPAFTGISSNDDPDVWVPAMMMNAVLAQDAVNNPGASSLYVFGRVQPGMDAAAASADIASVFQAFQASRLHDVEGVRGEVMPMAKGVQTLRPRFEKPLLILLGVAGFLLVIACANLAALLIARAEARRQEIAIRLALGATRGNLMRQFLTESLLLGVVGGTAGLALSAWGTTLITAAMTSSTRRLPLHFTVDSRVLVFTAVLSVLVSIVFGLLPALQTDRRRLVQAQPTAATRRHSGGAPARFLMAGQVALSLFLLTIAGLFIRSLGNLRQLDTGFVRDNVLVLMLDPRIAYGDHIERYRALARDLVARVEAMPGVRSASISSATFFGDSLSRGNITYEGHASEAPESEWPIKLRVTPGFAETLGLSLLAGRPLTDRDDHKAPRVALISESIGRRFFPGVDPIGKRFSFDSEFHTENAIEIVGVVRDVHYNDLRNTSPYTLYLPIQQNPSQRLNLQVRTHGDPAAMAAQVQDAVQQYDDRLRIGHTATLERLVEDSIAQDRLLALLAGFFAFLALLLSAVGLYGVTSYGVNRRTGEIGVRMALGASAPTVRWMVIRETLAVAMTGVAAGVPVALAAAQVIRGLLFGLSPMDPVTMAGSILVLLLAALLAAHLPSRRATRVDPIVALRAE